MYLSQIYNALYRSADRAEQARAIDLITHMTRAQFTRWEAYRNKRMGA